MQLYRFRSGKNIKTAVKRKNFLTQSIPSEKERGLILKNLPKEFRLIFHMETERFFTSENLGKIMEGIEYQTDFNQQITGFPVIFLRGTDSDYIPKEDFRDILNVFQLLISLMLKEPATGSRLTDLTRL